MQNEGENMVEKFHTAIMEADVITPEMLVEISNTINKANERILNNGDINVFGCCGATADKLKSIYDIAFNFNREYEMTIDSKIAEVYNEAPRIANEVF